MSFEPVVATLMGLLFLTELLSLEQSLGVLLIVIASLGTALQKKA
jgi:inner membrane transporter RhtA